MSPLHVATLNNHADCVRTLVHVGGASLTALDKHGRSPVMVAVHKGDSCVAALTTLLEVGASVVCSSHRGSLSALGEALRRRHRQCVLVLVSAGADLGAEDMAQLRKVAGTDARLGAFFERAHAAGRSLKFEVRVAPQRGNAYSPFTDEPPSRRVGLASGARSHNLSSRLLQRGATPEWVVTQTFTNGDTLVCRSDTPWTARQLGTAMRGEFSFPANRGGVNVRAAMGRGAKAASDALFEKGLVGGATLWPVVSATLNAVDFWSDIGVAIEFGLSGDYAFMSLSLSITFMATALMVAVLAGSHRRVTALLQCLSLGAMYEAILQLRRKPLRVVMQLGLPVPMVGASSVSWLKHTEGLCESLPQVLFQMYVVWRGEYTVVLAVSLLAAVLSLSVTLSISDKHALETNAAADVGAPVSVPWGVDKVSALYPRAGLRIGWGKHACCERRATTRTSTPAPLEAVSSDRAAKASKKAETVHGGTPAMAPASPQLHADDCGASTAVPQVPLQQRLRHGIGAGRTTAALVRHIINRPDIDRRQALVDLASQRRGARGGWIIRLTHDFPVIALFRLVEVSMRVGAVACFAVAFGPAVFFLAPVLSFSSWVWWRGGCCRKRGATSSGRALHAAPSMVGGATLGISGIVATSWLRRRHVRVAPTVSVRQRFAPRAQVEASDLEAVDTGFVASSGFALFMAVLSTVLAFPGVFRVRETPGIVPLSKDHGAGGLPMSTREANGVPSPGVGAWSSPSSRAAAVAPSKGALHSHRRAWYLSMPAWMLPLHNERTLSAASFCVIRCLEVRRLYSCIHGT